MSDKGFAQVAVGTRVSNSGDHEVVYAVDFDGKVWKLDQGQPRAKWVQLPAHPFSVDAARPVVSS